NGDAVIVQGHVYPHAVRCVHTPPQAPPRRESGLCRTGLPDRRGRITWSIMRDGGAPPPSILDECSRPGGRDATVSFNRSSSWRPERFPCQSSSPSSLSTAVTPPLPPRGTILTLAAVYSHTR